MRIVLGIWMVVVVILALLVSPPLLGLGDAWRIFYFHVPCAWVSFFAYAVAAYCGARYLLSRRADWDCKSAAASQIGLLFTVLATASGAVWAEAAWGQWWNWDPRETAVFIVLLVYGAYFALRMSIEQPEQRAAISAAYALIAIVPAIFLIYVAPRLVESLHPSPVLPGGEEKGSIEPFIRNVLFASLAGFTGLFVWMWRIQTRIERIALGKDAQL